MNKYRIRINGETVHRTVCADSFNSDGNSGITFYKRNNERTPHGLLEEIRFISNVAEVELTERCNAEDGKDDNWKELNDLGCDTPLQNWLFFMFYLINIPHGEQYGYFLLRKTPYWFVPVEFNFAGSENYSYFIW